MPIYKKIQFIAWEIHTGPIRNNGNVAYDYAGLKYSWIDQRVDVYSQCIDIEARIAFTKDAIEKAFLTADQSSDVLKVFMAPEFLYRGAGGAYVHDLIAGWEKGAPKEFYLNPPFDKNWPGLFGGLQACVCNDAYKDWVFVFGTAVSASFKTCDYEKKAYIDINQKCATYNTALIQRGGTDYEHKQDCHIVEKQMLSSIDFINFYLGAQVHSNGTILPTDMNSLMPQDVVNSPYVGNCIFQFDGIKKPDNKPIVFGLEICLDHIGYGIVRDPIDNTLIRSSHGRLRNRQEYVDIQLVPSGGMNLCENSISLLPYIGDKSNSYAFNCDGLTSGYLNIYREWGSHVAVWNQSDGDIILPRNRLISVSTDFNQIPLDATLVTDQIIMPIYNIGIIDAVYLWRAGDINDLNNPRFPKGAGCVQVFESLELE